MLNVSSHRNTQRPAPATNRGTRKSRRQRENYCAQLEALEDRQLFSTLIVTSLQDSGAGSLRATINAAQSGDTIVFASTLTGLATTSTAGKTFTAAPLTRSAEGTNNGKGHGNPTSPPPPPTPPPAPPTITLTSGELLLTKNLTIQGPGSGQLMISGNYASRLFEVSLSATVTLSGMTIAKGSSSYWTSYPVVTPWAGYGGGILNHGTLGLSDCTVSGAVYGSLARGGGIFSDGTLNVTGCTVSNCLADGSAGGDEIQEAACGGGIANAGTATLTNTIISNNSASATTTYPWFNKGGGVFNQGTLSLTGCIVSGNYSKNEGGGIFNDYQGMVVLRGSSVSGNLAPGGGGGITNLGTVTVRNSSSITRNFIGGYAAGDVDNHGELRRDSTSSIGVLFGNTAILI